MRHPQCATLNALATVAPDWLQARVPPEWYDRYSRRVEDYRLPRGALAQQAYAVQVGSDGGRLLALLALPQTSDALRSLPAVQLLQQFWEQEYVVDREGR